MWETFDWRRESRGQKQEGRSRGVLLVINHSSSALKREPFSLVRAAAASMQAPEPTLILGLIPERGNTFQSFTAHWPKKDKVTWGCRSWVVLRWVVTETQKIFW